MAESAGVKISVPVAVLAVSRPIASPAVRREPARRDDGAEDIGEAAGAEPGDHAPGQDELPGLGHEHA